MPKISAVIITLNEEKNLERCLSSLVDVADEILVVDSFSTDKTEEIAHAIMHGLFSINSKVILNKKTGLPIRLPTIMCFRSMPTRPFRKPYDNR